MTLSQAWRHGPRRGDQTGTKCSSSCRINTKARSPYSIVDHHNSDLSCPRSVSNLASISGKKSSERITYFIYFQVNFSIMFLFLYLCQCIYLLYRHDLLQKRLSSYNDSQVLCKFNCLIKLLKYKIPYIQLVGRYIVFKWLNIFPKTSQISMKFM